MHDSDIQNNFSREVHLSEVIDELWKKRKNILFISFLLGIISFLYSFSITDLYTSETLLKKSGSERLEQPTQLSSLSAAVGLQLGTGDDDIELAIETIESRGFLKHLITFEDVLPALYAAKGFDKSNQKIIYDKGLYNFSKNIWIKDEHPPSYLEIYESHYLQNLEIEKELNSNFFSLKFTHVSPVFAKRFLELIINELNNFSREKERYNANKTSEYIRNQLVLTKESEVRFALTKILELELKKLSFANVKEDFLLEIIDPPFVPEKKSHPRRSYFLFIGFMVGFFIYSFYLIFTFFYRASSTKQ